MNFKEDKDATLGCILIILYLIFLYLCIQIGQTRVGCCPSDEPPITEEEYMLEEAEYEAYLQYRGIY